MRVILLCAGNNRLSIDFPTGELSRPSSSANRHLELFFVANTGEVEQSPGRGCAHSSDEVFSVVHGLGTDKRNNLSALKLAGRRGISNYISDDDAVAQRSSQIHIIGDAGDFYSKITAIRPLLLHGRLIWCIGLRPVSRFSQIYLREF